MSKVNFYQSKKFLSMQTGLVAIFMAMELFEDFFTTNPNAVYVIFPSITILATVYALVEMSVDKARAKGEGGVNASIK
jgi:hypothetical protein